MVGALEEGPTIHFEPDSGLVEASFTVTVLTRLLPRDSTDNLAFMVETTDDGNRGESIIAISDRTLL